ncbi:MAG: homogentisate 1,2-dioxygenase [Bacteroidia bacterium]|nr:homogentisate 1,2-dioxygenase [Bacteroidia bacterium]
MPHYYSLGKIPTKRHTVYRQPDGRLYHEELVSTEGFSSDSSLVYHLYPPTQVVRIGEPISVAPKIVISQNLQNRCLLSFKITADNDYLKSRRILMANQDVQIITAAPDNSPMNYFYKNAEADEIIFIHEGRGILHTSFGELPFTYGDYLLIPRGVVHQFSFHSANNRLLIVESFSPVRFPKRYLSPYGQLLENAPFCERDLGKPENLPTIDQRGEFLIYIKKQQHIWPYYYENHPFDYVGWDGCYYPYRFSIHDFEPITGRVHQPPPVHQTFEGHNFVICSFVPRLYDYHPEAIPAPYHHSNLDSDEVLYYVAGEFMSRSNVEKGMLTLHPLGLPHGPHPGTIEKSIGAKETKELAVMIDTFKPLCLTEEALNIEHKSYYRSWVE